MGDKLHLKSKKIIELIQIIFYFELKHESWSLWGKVTAFFDDH
jgi:hypothetical protein